MKTTLDCESIPRTIILTVVLCGPETRCPTSREEQRLRFFKNRALMKMFGPKMEEVTGNWRTKRNQELHDLYSSQNIISVIKSRRMRWVGHVACMGRREMHKQFVGKTEGKRPVGRSRRRWDNTIIDLK
jgi:hypothetical protein